MKIFGMRFGRSNTVEGLQEEIRGIDRALKAPGADYPGLNAQKSECYKRITAIQATEAKAAKQAATVK